MVPGVVCAAILLCGMLGTASGSELSQSPAGVVTRTGRLADSHAGTSVRLTAASTLAGTAEFAVSRESTSEEGVRAFALSGVAVVLSLTVYAPDRAVIMVREHAVGQPTAVVVDVRSGKRLESFTITSPIELRSLGVLLYQEHASSATYAYDVSTLGRTKISDAQRAVLLLRYGTAFHKRHALQVIEGQREWWANEAIRRVFSEELGRALREDLRLAEERVQGRSPGIGVESERRAYFDGLVRLVGKLRDPRYLDLLVGADTWSASGALNSLGAFAAPSILAALQRATPPGYSPSYKEGLLRALLVVGSTSQEVLRDPAVASVLRSMLSAPPDWQVLRQAIEVVVEMDEDELFARVRQLAADQDLVTSLVGGDAAGAKAVSDTARLAVARRWEQP